MRTALRRSLELLVSVVLAIALMGNSAIAQRNICPWNNNTSWFEHFNNRSIVANAFIWFNSKSEAPKSEPWKGGCVEYAVYADQQSPGDDRVFVGWNGYLSNWHGHYIAYHPPGTPSTEPIVRWQGRGWERVAGVKQKTPRLDKFEIAIWDDIFVYNEAGEVFHREYGVVGVLKCSAPPPTASCMKGKIPSGQFFWVGGPY